MTQRFQYAPYGELISGGATQTPFLFNGMYGVMTDDNGLYYMRARFYSPEIKRFVNQDILLGNVAEGQTLNRFAYVTGNPVSFVDPFGLRTVIFFFRDKLFSHSSIYVETEEGKSYLYDPNGSYYYESETEWGQPIIIPRGSGDLFVDEQAEIQLYVDYHKDSAEDGDYGEALVFFTDSQSEEQIIGRFEQLGGGYGGRCAEKTFQAIEGIGPFKDIKRPWWWPFRITPALLTRELLKLDEVRVSHLYSIE